MANPEKKLVTQFTVLVRRASLQTERTHSNKNKRHLAGVILSSCKCTVKMGPCVTYGLIFNQTLCLQGIFGVTEMLLFPATYRWFDRSLVVSCSVAAKNLQLSDKPNTFPVDLGYLLGWGSRNLSVKLFPPFDFSFSNLPSVTHSHSHADAASICQTSYIQTVYCVLRKTNLIRQWITGASGKKKKVSTLQLELQRSGNIKFQSYI